MNTQNQQQPSPKFVSKRTPLKLLSLVLRIVLALGPVLAIILFVFLVEHKPKTEHAPLPERRIVVQQVVATPVNVARLWKGYGTARAMDAANISAELSARITHRPDAIEDGAAINKGDLIVALQETDFLAAVRSIEQQINAIQAQIQGLVVESTRLDEQIDLASQELQTLQWELEQTEELVGKGAGSSIELEGRKRSVHQTQRQRTALVQQRELIPSRKARLQALQSDLAAQLIQAQENLDRTRIISPITGHIESISVDVGELLTPGTRVARIVSIRRIEIPLALPISAKQSVRVGDAVTLRTDSQLDRAWSGTIARIAPEADASTRTLTVFVQVTQSPPTDALTSTSDLLLPGQFVIGTITTEQTKPRIVVPRRAVLNDAVYIASASATPDSGDSDNTRRIYRAVFKPVRVLYHVDASFPELDISERQWAVIDQGLEPGDRVIISNLDDIDQGVRIEIENGNRL